MATANNPVHSYKDERCIGDGIVNVNGSFYWNGSAVVNQHGKGFTILRIGTGHFRIQLDATFKSLLVSGANQNVNGTPAGFSTNACTSDDFNDVANQFTENQSGSQVELWTLSTSGNPTDPASTTRVCFWLALSDSKLNF